MIWLVIAKVIVVFGFDSNRNGDYGFHPLGSGGGYNGFLFESKVFKTKVDYGAWAVVQYGTWLNVVVQNGAWLR